VGLRRDYEDSKPIGFWIFREFITCTPAQADDQTCRVMDPTGTPLNVRTIPNGHIVGTLTNGEQVTVLDRTSDRRGKVWVYVGNYEDNKPIGWVFREFIVCRVGGAPASRPHSSDDNGQQNSRICFDPAALRASGNLDVRPSSSQVVKADVCCPWHSAIAVMYL